ncbi:conserved protein of unknown function [Shewanella benthica]|uniref:Uncharacterized protein n=1 Tax=Shewanella benthica TaxID=43661 RepID=A0A330M5W9_9GAMM|nr:conserved protein of unknown function [Shewanella benthica]
MMKRSVFIPIKVHCRTGSLESFHSVKSNAQAVHCRTGSLEKQRAVCRRSR